MGYTQYAEGVSLRSIIREHSSGWTNDHKDGSKTVVECLAKCLVGNRRFKCRLWVVLRPRQEDADGAVRYDSPFIAVWDLDCSGKKWGYRSHTESCHPFLYDCPLLYLAMCPEENAAWRQNVYAHHHENPRRTPRRRGQTDEQRQAAKAKKQLEAARQAGKYARLRQRFLNCSASPATDVG